MVWRSQLTQRFAAWKNSDNLAFYGLAILSSFCGLENLSLLSFFGLGISQLAQHFVAWKSQLSHFFLSWKSELTQLLNGLGNLSLPSFSWLGKLSLPSFVRLGLEISAQLRVAMVFALPEAPSRQSEAAASLLCL